MSQRAVEAVLGRMVMDERFREAFFEEPALACGAAGVELTGGELSALLRVDEGMLSAFAAGIEVPLPRVLGSGDGERADGDCR